jgi:hypothetical protein
LAMDKNDIAHGKPAALPVFTLTINISAGSTA